MFRLESSSVLHLVLMKILIKTFTVHIYIYLCVCVYMYTTCIYILYIHSFIICMR